VKSTLAFLVGAAAAVALLALALLALTPASRDVADIEVRTVPWRTQAGRIPKSYPPGQGFVAGWEGLRRIDVALVVQGEVEGAELELVLRSEGPDGDVLRRSRLGSDALPPTGASDWASFEFEPIAPSAGLRFWWQLELPGDVRSSPYTPWVRYDGQPGIDMAWGNRIVPGPVHEGAIADPSSAWGARDSYPRVPHPNLSALSFAIDVMRPAVGPCVLEIWGPDADPAVDPPLRRAELLPEEEVNGGYAFFSFEPIADSRWTQMRYRLTTNAGARVVGTEDGPSFKTWHGGGLALEENSTSFGQKEPPYLVGSSRAGVVRGDRSLVFRAYGSPQPLDAWKRAMDRAGWRLVAGALSWIVAVGVLARALALRQRS